MEDGSDAVRGSMSGLKAGCPGWAGCPGSGSVDELEEHHVERSNPGKIRRNLWMEIGEKWMES